MKMYKCANCPCVFREDQAKIIEDDMGVTDPYPIYKRFLSCPACGSEDLFDFILCEGCDDAEADKGLDGYCRQCYDNIHTGDMP